MARTIIEQVRSEMADTLVANRYGGGSATKEELLEKIIRWRSELESAEGNA